VPKRDYFLLCKRIVRGCVIKGMMFCNFNKIRSTYRWYDDWLWV